MSACPTEIELAGAADVVARTEEFLTERAKAAGLPILMVRVVMIGAVVRFSLTAMAGQRIFMPRNNNAFSRARTVTWAKSFKEFDEIVDAAAELYRNNARKVSPI